MNRQLTNIKFATDSFNFLNRLNHRYEIGQLNIGANKNNIYRSSLKDFRMDWKPECDYYCNECVPEIVKSKLYNRNPIRNNFIKLCKRYVYGTVPKRTTD
jgi:hypothetical protein